MIYVQHDDSSQISIGKSPKSQYSQCWINALDSVQTVSQKIKNVIDGSVLGMGDMVIIHKGYYIDPCTYGYKDNSLGY